MKPSASNFKNFLNTFDANHNVSHDVFESVMWTCKPHENDEYIVEFEEKNGGDEGSGEYMDVVFKVLDKKTSEVQYFRRTGLYSSCSDPELFNWEEVFPKEVTLVRFFEKE